MTAKAWLVRYKDGTTDVTTEEWKVAMWRESGQEVVEMVEAGAAEGFVLVPKEPSDGLLMSMAIRRDHGLGMPGYYDMFGPDEHENRLRVAITEARQAHEEVVGSGFYSKERDAEYRAMLAAAGGREG